MSEFNLQDDYKRCQAVHASGLRCNKRENHVADPRHVAVDNSRQWKERTGFPVWWEDAKSEPEATTKNDVLDSRSAPGPTLKQRREASRQMGFTGDPCPTCGALALVHNGTCLKCHNCGTTTGCS